jgi:hypothetical protein
MKTLIKTLAVVTALGVLSPALRAQWATHRDPRVPRLADGEPNLDAPTPRTPDGKPDLSGMWTRARGDGAGRGGRGQAAEPPPPGTPPSATFGDLGTNMPDGLPLTPWAAALKEERRALNSKENPDANCLPMGFTQFHQQPQPREIIQTPGKVLIIYEANYGLRQIYTDGRALPPQGEPQPWWYGYSVGHWEGETLVVETNNLRGAEDGPNDGWLDVRGSPYSQQATFTERFTRPSFGRLTIDATVDDPKAYTKPFTVRINQQIMVETELIEFVCNENQQFRVRVKID